MSLCYDLIDYVTSNAWTSEARNNITQCVKQYSHKNNFTSAPAGLLGQTTTKDAAEHWVIAFTFTTRETSFLYCVTWPLVMHHSIGKSGYHRTYNQDTTIANNATTTRYHNNKQRSTTTWVCPIY